MVTLVVLLTAGWPLLNTLVANELKVPAGTALRIGPSGPDSASVRVGPHWIMRPAQSDPSQTYVLARGDVTVSISYLALLHPYRNSRDLDRTCGRSCVSAIPASVSDRQRL